MCAQGVSFGTPLSAVTVMVIFMAVKIFLRGCQFFWGTWGTVQIDPIQNRSFDQNRRNGPNFADF
jgi:hypothetical protein